MAFMHLPGAPYNTHYPPVYPFILSLIWRVGGGFPANVTALVALNAVAVGAIAWGAHLLLTRIAGWSSIPAAIVAAGVTLSFPVLLLSGTLLSEPLFLALLLPMLAYGQRITSGSTPRTAIAFGLLCGLLMLVRTHGIVLPVAVALLIARRRAWRDATLVLGGMIVPVAIWQLWVSAHAHSLPSSLEGSYGSYLGWFFHGFSDPGFAFRTVSINTRAVWSLVGERFTPIDAAPLIQVAALLAVGAMIIGARRLWKSGSVAVLSAALYVAIVLVWPYTPWRFVYGIWPLLAILTVVGMRPMGDDQKRPRLIPLTVLMTGWLGAGWVRQEWTSWRTDARETPVRIAGQQALPSLQWIIGNTKPNDVVVSEASELVFLFSGRQSVPLMPFDAVEYGVPRSPRLDATGLQRMLHDVPSNYVVALSPAMRPAAALVTEPKLVPVDTVNGVSAYKVMR
jgi:hypothetical protein